MCYVGIDLGGTYVRYAFSNTPKPTILNCEKKMFVRTGNPLSEFEKNILWILHKTNSPIQGIAISFAAIMDRNTGCVKCWPNNACWNGFELVNNLKAHFTGPILIEDDANCGAISEYTFAHTSVDNMVYLSIGTGIGGGLIINRKLFRGNSGNAGEVGHMIINMSNAGKLCSCGNRGCFQAEASGKSIQRNYLNEGSLFFMTSSQIVSRYKDGDPKAVHCINNTIEAIAAVCYNLSMCLDISYFVIGGGVGCNFEDIIPQIQQTANTYASRFGKRIVIYKASLGEYNGIYGALLLLHQIVS